MSIESCPRSFVLTFVLAALALAPAATAQQPPELPAPSPKAKVEQRVGLTDFSVEYSSPAVKGRKIWGALVPFDKPWRTGANAATKLTASKDFTFGDKTIKAGSYSLFTVPGKTSWAVVLNSNPDIWGTQYDEKNDVARMTVKPSTLSAPRERLIFLFSDTANDGASLDLEWEKLRVRIPLKVDTQKQAAANIEQAVASAWRPHAQSARYLLDNGGDLDRALTYINASIAIQPLWNNHWLKAQILGKKGNKAEARAAAEQAQALGKGDQVFENNIKPDVDKAMASWR